MSAFNNPKKPLIISIEGNIGSGKSTIIEKLENSFGDIRDKIVLLKEPLGVWETIKDKVTGENLLEKFYKNQEKYAFPFQVMAYASRLSMIRNAIQENPNCSVIICERSLEADKNIFANMLHDDGSIEDINYQIYSSFCKEYARDFGLDGIIYIDADAEVCYKRVTKRSRQGEGGIPLEYLQKCKKYHDKWLSKLLFPDTNSVLIEDSPYILRIETNQDVTYDINDPNDNGKLWLEMICNFVRIQMNNKQN
jgi:deoxyadenosine/deoxycytidine kinase